MLADDERNTLQDDLAGDYLSTAIFKDWRERLYLTRSEICDIDR